MYIFNEKIVFHSNFNNKTLVGDTILVFPFTDIKSIEKKKTAFVFDNAISIFTVKGELFFTSFMARDKAYE